MDYHLSEKDVKVLKQTISTVDNISRSVPESKRPIIRNAFAYAELTEKDDNNLWSAKEVYFDETGTSSELVGGRTWGGDNPSIIINGTVSSGQVVRIESFYLVDSSDQKQPIWIGSAIGGGASIFRLRSKQSNIIGYIDLTETGFDLIDETSNILEVDVPVIQRKFNQCEFYENEILYATLDSNGVYDLSPFMSGVGVGNA
jgi:hypothetical protein